MVAELQNASIYTDMQGLSGLKLAAKEQTPEAVRAVAKQFEALFLQMVLKSMRDASPGDPLFDGEQSEVYRDMYDKQLALDISSKGKGIGLADMLVRQLQARQDGSPKIPHTSLEGIARSPESFQLHSHPEQAGSEVISAPGENVEQVAAGGDGIDGSPESFVRELWPLAKKAAARIGATPEALIAQAALETGWGKAVIRHADGGSSHNLFNIKADHRWDGDRVTKQTLEYRNGVAAKENASFRSYGSYTESFDDYTRFLEANPRYAEALRQAGDAKRYVRELQRAGYATDPEYSRKINTIIDRGVIADALDTLKSSAAGTLT